MIVEDGVRIEAPPDVVWAVTVDVERWPAWTPTVTALARLDGGPFGLGSAARIKQPAQPEAVWTVTEYIDGARFAWETRRRGLRMTGTHEVSAEGAGTRSVLRVEAEGAVAVLLWPVLRLAMRRALLAENRGLKGRCEALARGRSVTGSRA